MSNYQTTSKLVPIAVLGTAPLDADSPPGNSDIQTLLTEGFGSGVLEIFIKSDQVETLTDVRLSLREDNEFAILAQAGADDRIFTSLSLLANRSVKFAVKYTGRPTHAVLSAGGIVGAVTAGAKRVEG